MEGLGPGFVSRVVGNCSPSHWKNDARPLTRGVSYWRRKVWRLSRPTDRICDISVSRIIFRLGGCVGKAFHGLVGQQQMVWLGTTVGILLHGFCTYAGAEIPRVLIWRDNAPDVLGIV